MTLAELKALIDTNIPDNTTGLITPAKERQVMKAIADFVVSSQGEADSGTFLYDPAFTYAAGDPVIYDSAWYLSLVGSNLNNQPDLSPLSWDPINAFNTVLSIWEQDAVYLGVLTIVIKDNKLYLLDRDQVGAAPYVSTNFSTELAAGDWINLLPDNKPVANTYADTAAMIAAQGSQVEGYFYQAGTALYFYLGTIDGDIDDYYQVTGTAVTPTPPVAAVYTDTAAMIAAQGAQLTDYLYQAGTAFYRYKGTTVGDITDYQEVGGGGGLSDAPSDGVIYGRKDGGWVNTYPAAVERASNTVLFDKDYIIGNAAARTGNILFDFTGAKLGATTVMKHNDASAFTFPAEAALMFDSADISTSADNYFLFVLVKATSTQIVHVFHAMVGGIA